MIELPEAVAIAAQIDEHLAGKKIVSAERENSPHKWAFYNRPREEYEQLPLGRRIGKAWAEGSEIYVKPMHHYVTPGREMNFYTVLEAAKRRDEIAIGYIQGDLVEVNPVKNTSYTFQEGDRILVVAEH